MHRLLLTTMVRSATALLLAAPVPASAQAHTGPVVSRDSMTSFAVGGWGVATGDRDAGVRAGDDFYLSRNGGWLARTVLTPQEPAAAYWRDLQRLAPRRTTELLREAAANSAAAGSAEAMAGAFYRAYMDEAAIDRKGVTPLRPQLDAIRTARTRSALAAEMGREAGPGTQRGITFLRFNYAPGLFSVDIGQDPQDPSRHAIFIAPDGLLLPGPEYYADPELADIRAAFEGYIAQVLTMLGWPEPVAMAHRVIALETRIAAASPTHEQMRTAGATDTSLAVARLEAAAPGFDWRAFLQGAELGRVGRVRVRALDVVPGLAAIFVDTPIDVWQARQAFAIADIDARHLGSALARANFEFRARQFNSPLTVPPPRGSNAGVIAEGSIGGIIGTLYAARYLTPEVKSAALTMAEGVRQAFADRLAHASWMSPDTRARARGKVSRIALDVGYPDTYKAPAALVVSDTDHYGNVVRARAFAWRERVHHLNDPFDRTAWPMTPQTATYGYTVETNAIVMPAALLQPPFFDPQADPAVNYGAIGALMGGQVASALDDRGRHFDADGRRRELLAPDETRRFLALRQAISDRYSRVEPLPGLHLKGDLLADEAIDDLGGLLAALDAYHASLGGGPAPVIDGYTGDERFFLGWAQMWRAKFAPAFVRAQVATGANAPPCMRVNGPLRHVDAWYAAFDVQPTDRMFLPPGDRVRIW
jgi:putative endopeptidase